MDKEENKRRKAEKTAETIINRKNHADLFNIILNINGINSTIKTHTEWLNGLKTRPNYMFLIRG